MGLNIADLLTGVSAELTADDLAGGPRFLKITKLVITEDPKRPLSVYYEGDDGRPWRPCLSMRRVLAGCFGTDSDSFLGQVVEVFRDGTVTYGEKGQGVLPVGGVRIKRASIKERISLCLQARRGKKTIWIVDPIPAAELKGLFPASAAPAVAPEQVKTILNRIKTMHATALDPARQRAEQLQANREISALDYNQILAAIEARATELTTTTTEKP